MFCISSSPSFCDGAIGLSASLAAIFTVRQLHPAGCGVGVPSVVWEFCLRQHNTGRGIYTLQRRYLAVISTPYAFDLVQMAYEQENCRRFYLLKERKDSRVFVYILMSLCVIVLNFYSTKCSHVLLNLTHSGIINVDNNREDSVQCRIN